MRGAGRGACGEDCDFGKDWITLLNVTGDVPGAPVVGRAGRTGVRWGKALSTCT